MLTHIPTGWAEALARYVEQVLLSARVKLAVVFNWKYDDGMMPNSIAALSRADYSSPALARLYAKERPGAGRSCFRLLLVFLGVFLAI